jgi:hypothetical protein
MPFSFLNTALLAGLAAAAVPILIHLFSRRKIARVPFSSIQFLEEIARRRVRRLRLTQWLILAMRVLAVALLALALGRPAFRGDFAFGKSRGESAVAIVLDRSASMGAEGQRRTLWEKARDRAVETLDAMEGKDQVFLIGVDPRMDAVDSYPDPLSAKETVRALETGYGTTDLAAAVRRAVSSLAGATALNKELFIISDFQRSGFGDGSGPGQMDLLADLEPRTRVFLIPVDEGPLDNTALEDAYLSGGAVAQRVLVQGARHADTPVDAVPVTVEAGSEVIGEAPLSISADSRETLEITLNRMPGEDEEIAVRLARDRLPADDIRYVPAAGGGRVRTLLVQDPAQPSPFLPTALSPAGDLGRFEVRRVAPEALLNADLAQLRLLVLDNVTSIPREAIVRLRQWREAGGALLIVLGDRVDIRFYNEALLPALFEGVRLGNLRGTDEATGVSYSLVPRAAGHEAFAGFDAEVGRPLTGADFWRIIEVQNDPGVRTLAEFGPALPALVQGDRALLFASALDGRWNNFPTHAAFLPLLHQSLDAVLREGDSDRILVGQPVEGVVDRALVPTGADLYCVGPGGVLLDVTREEVPRGMKLRAEAAPVPGFYTMRAGDRVVMRRAVNMDAAESDLTPLSHAEIRQAFAGETVKLLEEGDPLGTPIREARYGREFWRELVAAAFLLLVTEGWLSRRGVV